MYYIDKPRKGIYYKYVEKRLYLKTVLKRNIINQRIGRKRTILNYSEKNIKEN